MKKRDRRSEGGTWWGNEEMEEAVIREMHTRQCVEIVRNRIRRCKLDVHIVISALIAVWLHTTSESTFYLQ